MTLETNIAAGEKSVKLATHLLPLGSNNIGTTNQDVAKYKLVDTAKLLGFELKGNETNVDGILKLAKAAEMMQAGNCQEHAALVFRDLYHSTIRPIDYMGLADSDHRFVVIGRAEGNANDLSTWGDEAVWCDAWVRVQPKHMDAANGVVFSIKGLRDGHNDYLKKYFGKGGEFGDMKRFGGTLADYFNSKIPVSFVRVDR